MSVLSFKLVSVLQSLNTIEKPTSSYLHIIYRSTKIRKQDHGQAERSVMPDVSAAYGLGFDAGSLMIKSELSQAEQAKDQGPLEQIGSEQRLGRPQTESAERLQSAAP